MRANKKKPENPVQKTVESLGAVPAGQFPEITEEQQQIIPPFEAVEVEPVSYTHLRAHET